LHTMDVFSILLCQRGRKVRLTFVQFARLMKMSPYERAHSFPRQSGDGGVARAQREKADGGQHGGGDDDARSPATERAAAAWLLRRRRRDQRLFSGELAGESETSSVASALSALHGQTKVSTLLFKQSSKLWMDLKISMSYGRK